VLVTKQSDKKNYRELLVKNGLKIILKKKSSSKQYNSWTIIVQVQGNRLYHQKD